MRTILILAVTIAACSPGGVTQDQELCAKAAAMFSRCEETPELEKLDRELMVDRFRGLCRAVITGETKQLLPDALQLFQTMDEGTKLAIKTQAECMAKTTTCAAYAACSP